MEMADQAAMDAYNAQTQQSQAGRILVQFTMEAEKDEQASIEAGRPIYREAEYVRKQIPGDKDNVIFRPVRHTDKIEFAQEYAAFKNGQEAPIVGTPIDTLPFFSKAQVAEFAAVGIRTAEHIRDMSDSVAQRFMGIQSIKKRVNDFLEAAAGAAPAEKLRAELEKRDATIGGLQAQLKDLAEKFEKAQKQKQQ